MNTVHASISSDGFPAFRIVLVGSRIQPGQAALATLVAYLHLVQMNKSTQSVLFSRTVGFLRRTEWAIRISNENFSLSANKLAQTQSRRVDWIRCPGDCHTTNYLNKYVTYRKDAIASPKLMATPPTLLAIVRIAFSEAHSQQPQ
jgi:hypothetical protein